MQRKYVKSKFRNFKILILYDSCGIKSQEKIWILIISFYFILSLFARSWYILKFIFLVSFPKSLCLLRSARWWLVYYSWLMRMCHSPAVNFHIPPRLSPLFRSSVCQRVSRLHRAAFVCWNKRTHRVRWLYNLVLISSLNLLISRNKK